MEKVTFTPEEMAQCVFRASLVSGVKEVNNRAGEVQNRRVCEMTDFELHLIGELGEAAVAKRLGISRTHRLTKFGDGGVDLQYRGKTVQVKTRKKRDRDLYFYLNRVEEFVSDCAILCTIDTPCSILIHGALSREFFLQNCETKDWGYGDRVAVSAGKLQPLKPFFENREQTIEEMFK